MRRNAPASLDCRTTSAVTTSACRSTPRNLSSLHLLNTSCRQPPTSKSRPATASLIVWARAPQPSATEAIAPTCSSGRHHRHRPIQAPLRRCCRALILSNASATSMLERRTSMAWPTGRASRMVCTATTSKIPSSGITRSRSARTSRVCAPIPNAPTSCVPTRRSTQTSARSSCPHRRRPTPRHPCRPTQ